MAIMVVTADGRLERLFAPCSAAADFDSDVLVEAGRRDWHYAERVSVRRRYGFVYGPEEALRSR
jgi:hypothetical protein